jgi:hypothetical protein
MPLNPEDDPFAPKEDDDEPLSPEEEAERKELEARIEAEFEAEATEYWGPRELRDRKNRRYVDRLVRRYSEPVIRGLLVALSSLKRPLCAQDLSEIDLATTPLEEIIQPFQIYGRRFKVLSVEDEAYTVEISAGYRTAGGGGRFLIARSDEEFVITKHLEWWMS